MINLDQLHQNIIDRIKLQFPALVTVEDYREDRKRLPVPACLIELTDLEPNPDEDPGTEQLAVLARFDARIVIGFRTTKAQREIRKLAAALATFIQGERFGLPIGPAVVTSITPDDFSPELDQFEVWRVEWQQPVSLGASVWDGSSFPARMVLQLGQTTYDPTQPAAPQMDDINKVVLARPIDPAKPNAEWTEGERPEQAGALYSYAPDIGPDHIDDYKPLVPEGDQ